jgi:hypothetical protein
VRHRWLVFLAALAGSALLAGGFAIAADRVAAVRAPAPHLATVPAATLRGAGYTLSPPAEPPYCGVVEAAAAHRWLRGSAAGCPIDRDAASEAATSMASVVGGGGPTAKEALLARVSAGRSSSLGQGHLTWLVVVHTNAVLLPMLTCASPAVGGPCPPQAVSVFPTSVVFVDAQSGRVMEVLPVGRVGPIRPGKPVPMPLPLPVPYPTPTAPGPATVKPQATS